MESADNYHAVCQSERYRVAPRAGPGASAPHKPRPCGLDWFGVNLQIAPNFKEYHPPCDVCARLWPSRRVWRFEPEQDQFRPLIHVNGASATATCKHRLESAA